MGFYEVNMRHNFSGGAIYFKRAADKGDRDGLSNLAVSYDNGWVAGHPPDKVFILPRIVFRGAEGMSATVVRRLSTDQ